MTRMIHAFAGWKRLALLAALATITLTALILWGGGRTVLDAVAGANGWLLLLALLIHYSGFAVRGHRWQRLLAMGGHRLPYGWLTGLLFSGWFISALLPARAGDLARIGLLRTPPPASPGRPAHPPVPVADSLGSIVLERALDMFAILLLGAGFGYLALRERLPGWLLVSYAGAGALLALLAIALLVAPRLFALLRRFSPPARLAPLWEKGWNFAGELVASMRTLAGHPARALLVAGESLYIWLCDGLLLWLVMRSLHIDVDFGSAAFVALSTDVLAAVPLTPGGIGQIEVAYGALLALLSLSGAGVPVIILVTRAISYWSFLVVSGGIAALLGMDRVMAQIAPHSSTTRPSAQPSTEAVSPASTLPAPHIDTAP